MEESLIYQNLFIRIALSILVMLFMMSVGYSVSLMLDLINNYRKKISKSIIPCLLILILLCACENRQVINFQDGTSKRIIEKEDRIIHGYSYQIIEIDGSEYLCQPGGGICLIVKTVK